MEHAVLWHRGPRLVPRLPLPYQVRQGGFLPRHVAASSPARRVQAEGSALPRHPRGRQARRSSTRRLGEASQPIARRTNVMRWYQVLTSDTQVTNRANDNYEESDNNHE